MLAAPLFGGSAAIGRMRTFISTFSGVSKRPLSGKADVCRTPFSFPITSDKVASRQFRMPNF